VRVWSEPCCSGCVFIHSAARQLLSRCNFFLFSLQRSEQGTGNLACRSLFSPGHPVRSLSLPSLSLLTSSSPSSFLLLDHHQAPPPLLSAPLPPSLPPPAAPGSSPPRLSRPRRSLCVAFAPPSPSPDSRSRGMDSPRSTAFGQRWRVAEDAGGVSGAGWAFYEAARRRVAFSDAGTFSSTLPSTASLLGVVELSDLLHSFYRPLSPASTPSSSTSTMRSLCASPCSFSLVLFSFSLGLLTSFSCAISQRRWWSRSPCRLRSRRSRSQDRLYHQALPDSFAHRRRSGRYQRCAGEHDRG
jgi:hypothetical protein